MILKNKKYFSLIFIIIGLFINLIEINSGGIKKIEIDGKKKECEEFQLLNRVEFTDRIDLVTNEVKINNNYLHMVISLVRKKQEQKQNKEEKVKKKNIKVINLFLKLFDKNGTQNDFSTELEEDRGFTINGTKLSGIMSKLKKLDYFKKDNKNIFFDTVTTLLKPIAPLSKQLFGDGIDPLFKKFKLISPLL